MWLAMREQRRQYTAHHRTTSLLNVFYSVGHSVLKKYRGTRYQYLYEKYRGTCMKKYRGTRYRYFLKKYRVLYTVLGTVL